MKLVLVAVGPRQPAWADAAFDDFAKRFPAECRLELKAVKAEPRTSGKPVRLLCAGALPLAPAGCTRKPRSNRSTAVWLKVLLWVAASDARTRCNSGGRSMVVRMLHHDAQTS